MPNNAATPSSGWKRGLFAGSEFLRSQFLDHGIQLGVDHIEVGNRIHDLIVCPGFAGTVELGGQFCQFLVVGIGDAKIK